mmetsp:Transcript_93180/g.164826  ORF Transcript_93180/g.164826 Transcript_93180/m.164826 type:complete len:180 (+) Transcript_93180:78-617(+)
MAWQTPSMTPLHIAAGTGNIAELNRILNDENLTDEEAEALPEKQDDLGRTPLHVAAMTGEAATAASLCEFGADPSKQDNDGNTPIHLTAVYGKHLVTSMLCWAMSASGGDIHAVNSQGNTPLHEAAIHDHDKVAWQVMEKCDLDMKTMTNKDGKTPMDLAKEKEANKVLHLFKTGDCSD